MKRLFAPGADAVIATGTLPLGPAADATFAALLRFTEDYSVNSAEGE